MTFRWNRIVQSRLIIPIVALCAVSNVALSQVRILCELGDRLPSGHSHSNSDRDLSHEASEKIDGHSHGTHIDAAAATQVADSGGHARSEGHSHSDESSGDEESCCDSISSDQWAKGPNVIQVVPSELLYVLAYTIVPHDPLVMAGNKEQMRLSRSNAPPLFSQSHIPTTVLLL